ncbi:SGNH/GDSL hydrolase family protein [Yinghuangia sp. ASG 101]|uniref:SGNH/GDSL hydrolase family protein n=1 Tax=Yinghuangia sp. ASG 101 TaxID=2896848 RepID=UPI001E5A57E7|nr:SGNH/GDSL hydrolase family protein [Yinghuangia sp. ASG 101]UGQ12010.1 SGNH/GDSL hydrolase family protein [Yinghuangia sp. ASG 101]
MNRSVRTGVAGAAACGALIAAIGIAWHDDGDGETTAPKGPFVAASGTYTAGPYVALGDSYTAAPGITAPSGDPVGCDRSSENYPALVARRLNLAGADFRDVSCSGATLADLSAAQDTDDGSNPPQMAALTAATRLVTLGIGGNDIGFSAMIKKCVTAGVLYHAAGGAKNLPDAPCEKQYTPSKGGTDQVDAKIRTAGEHLATTLGEIRQRAPQARVYVVGYPAILPSDNHDCGREMGLAPGDVAFLRGKEQRLNTMLRQQAEGAGVVYVDTYRPSEGHDACSAPDERWIEPLIPHNPAAAVHPNGRGEQGMADAVLRALTH